MSWLRQLQLQLIYTVATHHRALFPATPLLLNVIKKYVMKADKLFKSLPVSLGSVAQLHAADATENCQKDQNNSFPWRTSKYLAYRMVSDIRVFD